MQELLEAFENDVKMRVVRGKVQEHLSTWEKTQTKIEPPRRQPPLPPPPAPYVKPEALPSTSSIPTPFAPPPLATESTPQPSIKGGLATLSFAKRNKGQNGSTAAPRSRQRSVSRISSEAPSESPAPAPHAYLRDHDMSEEDGEEEVKKPVRRPVGRPRKNPLPPNSQAPTNTNKGRKPARIASESEGEEMKVRRKKQEDKDKKKREKDKEREKKLKKAKVHLSYTSSEGEDGEEEEETRDLDPPPLRMEDLVSRSTSPELNMKPIEEYRRERSGEVDEEEEEEEPSFIKKLMKKKHGLSALTEEEEAMQIDGDVSAMPTPDATAPSPSLHGPEEEEEEQEDSGSDSDRPLSPATIRAKRLRRVSALPRRPVTSDPFEAGIAADEEDLFYLKLAIERLQLGHDFQPTPPGSEDESNNLKHPSGCARTEGFYKVTIEEKMANRPASNRAKAAADSGASAVAVSRLARANTRGLVRGMELHKKVTATDTDVLKFNQLKTRKKQLTFSRSGIEGYGLFAKERVSCISLLLAEPCADRRSRNSHRHIPQGDMVIEYVGELIRQQVADLREKAYERQGIGSSYLFRVDEDLVVDATKKGNLGYVLFSTLRLLTTRADSRLVHIVDSSIIAVHRIVRQRSLRSTESRRLLFTQKPSLNREMKSLMVSLPFLYEHCFIVIDAVLFCRRLPFPHRGG